MRYPVASTTVDASSRLLEAARRLGGGTAAARRLDRERGGPAAPEVTAGVAGVLEPVDAIHEINERKFDYDATVESVGACDRDIDRAWARFHRAVTVAPDVVLATAAETTLLPERAQDILLREMNRRLTPTILRPRARRRRAGYATAATPTRSRIRARAGRPWRPSTLRGGGRHAGRPSGASRPASSGSSGSDDGPSDPGDLAGAALIGGAR